MLVSYPYCIIYRDAHRQLFCVSFVVLMPIVVIISNISIILIFIIVLILPWSIRFFFFCSSSRRPEPFDSTLSSWNTSGGNHRTTYKRTDMCSTGYTVFLQTSNLLLRCCCCFHPSSHSDCCCGCSFFLRSCEIKFFPLISHLGFRPPS